MSEHEAQIEHWLRQDAERMAALHEAAQLGLNDWCLAAGFVRNLVWDRLHGYLQATPLADIDLIHFDAGDTSEASDREFESRLKATSLRPWSVKNQARMHLRNQDAPYRSTSDAMSHWVEVETAVGVRLLADGSLEVVAPFGCDALLGRTITINSKRRKPQDFHSRIEQKGWLQTWPELTVVA